MVSIVTDNVTHQTQALTLLSVTRVSQSHSKTDRFTRHFPARGACGFQCRQSLSSLWSGLVSDLCLAGGQLLPVGIQSLLVIVLLVVKSRDHQSPGS